MARGLIELKGGVIVSEPVLVGMVDLEARGFAFRVEEGRIFVEPSDRLTDADRAFLRGYRGHVLAILGYQPPEATS